MHDRASPHHALASAVRERRRELGLDQVELAELANCSTRFIHSVEAGKPSLRLDKLLDVLRVLGLSLRVVRGDGAVLGPEEPQQQGPPAR
jgi:y4mF family transcriptional regulator